MKMAAPQETPKTPKSKETSGLLMSIIRTLSSSADIEQREKEKARLEKAYKESDRKVDKLVTENLTDLTSIIQAFSKISGRVTGSQERIHAIKDNLQSCKNLLHCKRDELRKLWLEGIEQKTVVAMLNQVEKVKDVGDKLAGFIEKKHYLHGTELMVSSVSLLEGDLNNVEALRDVKTELITRKEELHDVLIEELHKQIYIKSISGVVKGFQRQGSLRASQREKAPPKITKGPLAQVLAEEDITDPTLKKLTQVSLEDIATPKQINEDLNADAEEDPVHFIAILVECLSMLNRLPEAIDAIRSRIKPGLLAIVQRASQQVADNAYFEGENLGSAQQPQYLLELLELILQQFKVVAHTHEIVLANLQRVKTSNSTLGDICLYDTVEVWMKIQSVLQLFLSDYLDIRNTASTQGQSVANFDEPTTDIASYFARKKPGKPKKLPLFRFDASSHAISMNSYLREQRQEFYGSGEILSSGESGEAAKTQTVCKPGANNITVIYNPLQKFIKDIENATKATPGSCTLEAFMTEFIKNIYLGQVMYNIHNNIDLATKGFDAQRTIIDQRTQKELAVAKPLLQSTVAVAQNIQECQGLMKDLPDYADQFLNMICKILQEYKETCLSSYRDIVLSDSEEKRIISASWAKDEDIGRFLRCLPNWQHLKDEMDSSSMSSSISEEDMRALNSKESSILTSNLSSTESLIPQQEIITDPAQLRTLGNMCESLGWFSGRIRSLAENLSTKKTEPPATTTNESITTSTSLTVSEETLETLLGLAQDFQELGEVCLLVLHLEVRVHCFFYLMPVAKMSNYSGAIDDMDPDSNVLKLIKGLVGIEEVMTQSLQPRKFKYVYEGLGHLVSSILINSTQYFKRINENGIKKMCRNIFALQQSLTNITMNRESDLDHARQYYELLYLTAEELVTVVIEQGPKFTQLEYMNLLDLQQRSKPNSRPEIYTKALQRLKDIFAESRY